MIRLRDAHQLIVHGNVRENEHRQALGELCFKPLDRLAGKILQRTVRGDDIQPVYNAAVKRHIKRRERRLQPGARLLRIRRFLLHGAAADVLRFMSAGGEHHIVPVGNFVECGNIALAQKIHHVARDHEQSVLLLCHTDRFGKIFIGCIRRIFSLSAERPCTIGMQCTLRFRIALGRMGEMHIGDVQNLHRLLQSDMQYSMNDFLHQDSSFRTPRISNL